MSTSLKTIEIIVAVDGSSTVETNGFVGTECQQASRFVEVALGERGEGQLKPEFYQQAISQEARQQHS